MEQDDQTMTMRRDAFRRRHAAAKGALWAVLAALAGFAPLPAGPMGTAATSGRALHAAEDDDNGNAAAEALSWEISPGRVRLSPSGPFPLELDGETYWLFTLAFQPLTAQELLREAYQAVLDNADRRDAEDQKRIEAIDASDRPNAEKTAMTDALNQQMRRRREELPNVQAQVEALEREASQRRRANIVATLHSEGRVYRDLADEAIRNLFERRQGDRRYYTAIELAKVDLASIEPERLRNTQIQGRLARVVDVLLVFPRALPAGQRVELRVQGLGNVAFPRFEPGALMYAANLMIDDPSTSSGRRFYDPALVKVLRAFYDVSGGEARPRFRLDEVKSDWLWIWTARLRAGHVRELSLSRGSAGVERRMRYVPMLFVNDTARPQPFAVNRAGIFADIEWLGVPLRARFTDGIDPDAYWTTLVERAVRERVESGEEARAVKEFEEAVLPGVDSRPDLERKAAVLPAEGQPRLPKGVLAPQTYNPGLLVARSELDNLDGLIDDIATRLWLDLTLNDSDPEAEAPSPLFAAYRALYPTRPEGLRDEEWALLRPAELPEERVERFLLAQARAALAESGDGTPSDDEFRLYNRHRFAPLAVDMVLDWPALAKNILEGEGAAERLRARFSDVVMGILRRAAAGADAANAPTPNELAVAVDAINRALAEPTLFVAADYEAVEAPELRELFARGRALKTEVLVNLTRPEQFKANRLVFDGLAGESSEPVLDRAILGHLLNGLADASMKKLQSEGLTGVFLSVTANESPDEADLFLPFKQYIPPLFPPYRVPEVIEAIIQRKTAVGLE